MTMKRSAIRFGFAVGLTTIVLVERPGRAQGVRGIDCVRPVDLQSPFQDLSGCNLNRARIDGPVALFVSDLSGAHLNQAEISGVNAAYACNLVGARMDNAIISGESTLASSNLTGASLIHATISGPNALAGANLTNADLLGAAVSPGAMYQAIIYNNTRCPDGTNSNDDGGTCVGHGVP
jgi:uncharacterized protein YjbI with pentapeptide repeats